jgi:D-alanine-D-alanine ligase
MRIGLTFDLREDYLASGFGEEETAEFDASETIAELEAALRSLGHEPERIGHLDRLLGRLAAGERWPLVFNIAEGLYGFGREAQVPAVLDAYRIPYVFSDPLVLALTLHKGMAKHVARDCGVPTPAFAVVAEPADVAAVELPYPLFVKPVAEGTGKGIGAASKVSAPAELASVCRTLLARFDQPVLVETFLPGREFTVGIVGTGRAARSLGVMEVRLGSKAEGEAYTYENKEHYEDRVDYRLVRGDLARRVNAVALAAWRCLGCRDGGRVDLRMDADGVPNFLEVNPLAGLNPVRSDLVILARLAGIGHEALIGRILDSALERIAAAPDTAVPLPAAGRPAGSAGDAPANGARAGS